MYEQFFLVKTFFSYSHFYSNIYFIVLLYVILIWSTEQTKHYKTTIINMAHIRSWVPFWIVQNEACEFYFHICIVWGAWQRNRWYEPIGWLIICGPYPKPHKEWTNGAYQTPNGRHRSSQHTISAERGLDSKIDLLELSTMERMQRVEVDSIQRMKKVTDEFSQQFQAWISVLTILFILLILRRENPWCWTQ